MKWTIVISTILAILIIFLVIINAESFWILLCELLMWITYLFIYLKTMPLKREKIYYLPVILLVLIMLIKIWRFCI